MENVMKSESTKQIVIAAPNFKSVEFTIEGTAPFVSNNFSQEAMDMMKGNTQKVSGAKGGKREPKNYTADYEGSKHVSVDGWLGISCSSFRQGAISACRIVGFKMTLAKLGIFIRPDGFDKASGEPLVRIVGTPRMAEHTVRLASGVAAIKARAMFDTWSAKIVVDYDGDMFGVQDLYNLFMRLGLQVGIGAGRPDSKTSAGMGWGTFRVVSTRELA